MKVAFSITALIAAVSAQSSQGYNVTSKPFQLLLHGNFSGVVNVCDVGANLRSLPTFCFYGNSVNLEPTDRTTFNLNSTIDAVAPSNRTDLGIPGILSWYQPIGNRGPPFPTALYFEHGDFDGFGNDDWTPIMRSDGSYRMKPDLFAFNNQDELVVFNSAETKRWFLCWHNFSGYQYNILVYGVGVGKPANPPCVPVGTIKRIFN
ncbi:hypothetical protein CC86DRAFT_167147 [Ophiobolus disseminans]|uniref:Uncharacterized protein n=1 Tax=Ophiobolus disseminans TaxID=1469910 RepID=A0A6A7AD28_9PLEO|nr:hypothetical protein CC86DRAFT_167147 [Ophiobolus disseminans]